MRYLLPLLLVIGCRSEPGFAPANEVAAELSMHATLTLKVPKGYHNGSRLGDYQQWTRADEDPAITILGRRR